MREIKFRCWDKASQSIFEVHEINFHHDTISCYDGNAFGPNTSLRQRNGKDCVLMQFTGLKDKNGKEIYESDILTNGTNKGQVGWIRDCWNIEGSYNMMNLGVWEDYEIIGNIWENEELLNDSEISKKD